MKPNLLVLVGFLAVVSVSDVSFAETVAPNCAKTRTFKVPVAAQRCAIVSKEVTTGRIVCTPVRKNDFVSRSCQPETTKVDVTECQTVFVDTPKVLPGCI
ncbi:hypothetical protein [Rhizobium sp. BK176]|uniref:hypothetical protein n=1 Tax=Rhizobium sp. BK176 TaxID=2587071 RepID=UPI002167197E|nr:hypothetical protein [Rhizobium sp. BK176]MCS4089534.1 hypothetical protein [Rhizobium sp. BK176]